MHRRLYAHLASLAMLPALAGGCVQMTRHSNMMIFGTNTVVGIRAGVNATSVPEVAIGYTRQEAVVLPLVANVAESSSDPKQLIPCNPGNAVTVTGPQSDERGFLVHPCSLVGINGKALDSYSVLASFGGKFTVSHDGKTADASGGVAQYFATGIAAQTLALNGGAAVVAGGDAAAAATGRATVLATNEATPDEVAAAAVKTQDYAAAVAPLLVKIRGSASLAREFDKFEAAIVSKRKMSAACRTGDQCATKVDREKTYRSRFEADHKIFNDAVVAWQTN